MFNSQDLCRFVLGVFFVAIATPAQATLLLSTTDHTVVDFTEDLELTHSVAPPPAEVPEAPMSASVPTVRVRRDQWQGSQCGVTEERHAVFHHDDKWQTFWQQGLAPYSPKLKKVPTVDFAKEMIVGVFLGEKPMPHFQIEIVSARVEDRPGQGHVFVVRYRQFERMSGVFVPPFAVQPFHLKRVPTFDGPVVFEPTKQRS